MPPSWVWSITGGYNQTINRTPHGLTFRHVPASSRHTSGIDQHLTNVLTKKKVEDARVGYYLKNLGEGLVFRGLGMVALSRPFHSAQFKKHFDLDFLKLLKSCKFTKKNIWIDEACFSNLLIKSLNMNGSYT